MRGEALIVEVTAANASRIRWLAQCYHCKSVLAASGGMTLGRKPCLLISRHLIRRGVKHTETGLVQLGPLPRRDRQPRHTRGGWQRWLNPPVFYVECYWCSEGQVVRLPPSG